MQDDWKGKIVLNPYLFLCLHVDYPACPITSQERNRENVRVPGPHCCAWLDWEGSTCLCCIEIQREQVGKFLQHLEEIELSQNTEMDFSGKRYILLKAKLEKIKMVKMCPQHAPAVLQNTIYFCFPVVSYCRCTGMPAFSYPVFNIIYLILSHYFFILVPGNALTALLV